jgi:hypothetical protein
VRVGVRVGVRVRAGVGVGVRVRARARVALEDAHRVEAIVGDVALHARSLEDPPGYG